MQVQITKTSGDKNLFNLDTKGGSALRDQGDRSWDAALSSKENLKKTHKTVFYPNHLGKKQPTGIIDCGCMFELLR